MSDDSDIQNKTGKRRKRPINSASPSECSDTELPTIKCSRTQLNETSEEDGSSSEEEEIISIRPAIKRGATRILSDHESGSSDNQNDIASGSLYESSSEDEVESSKNTEQSKLAAGGEWDSGAESDGQSEKCPICLARFTSQEVGTPEACDHCFCADCIQEWAKNVNTCPVDRQPFTLILVRDHLEGKVVRQIPVSPPDSSQSPDTTVEDLTYCEVCGQSDREDRMLLCDGCDHGYHMECLTPALDTVPIDEWFCQDCINAGRRQNLHRVADEIVRQMTENPAWIENGIGHINTPRTRSTRRMVARTRHSERVRTSLRNRQGNQPFRQMQNQQPSTSLGAESMDAIIERVSRGIGRTIKTRRRTTKRKRNSNIRIKRIVTDDGVVEVILKRKKKKRYTRKRKNGTVRSRPRTTKGRLANKLGMCRPRVPRQTVPETLNRQELANASLNHQRHQAGLPTLDLFGRRDQLDYFSGSDYEEDTGGEGGVGVLSRVRVARPSDRLISRKKALSVLSSTTSKEPKAQPIAAPASGSLLDSILDSQTLWHSKKVEIKSSRDGSVQVILPNKNKEEIVKESNKVDVRTATAPVVEAPMFPGGRGQSIPIFRPQNRRGGGGGGNEGVVRGEAECSYEGSGSQQSSGVMNTGFSPPENTGGSGPSPLRGMAPIRFRMNVPPRRPNIHSYPTDNIPPPPPMRLRTPVVEAVFPTTNSPEASPAREDEEIDIYSDIEQHNNDNEGDEKSFGTLEPPPEPPFMMTLEPPPEPPAILMNINEDASDDEPSGLVIDDLPLNDVYDPCESGDSSQENLEDTNLPEPPELPMALINTALVSNYSSGSSPATESSSYNPELPSYSNTAMVIPLPRPSSRNSSEADDNDEECPNFSMYSAESMNLAQRGLSSTMQALDIPIPPIRQAEKSEVKENIDIPLPDMPSPKLSEANLDIPIPQEDENVLKFDIDGNLDIPFPEDSRHDESIKVGDTNLDIPFPKDENYCKTQSVDDDDDDSLLRENKTKADNNKEKSAISLSPLNINHSPEKDDQDKDEGELDEDDSRDGDDEGDDADDNKDDSDSADECSIPDADYKPDKPQKVQLKGSEEAAEDECSTQGDVLDLAIEAEANLENNVPHEDTQEHHEINSLKSLGDLQEVSEKELDDGEKSDGLDDITDEEMSVYDTQEAVDDLKKSDKHNIGNTNLLYSDDDSLVMCATSAVPAQTLPGLEGLETETISESEDVNFDELPPESNGQTDMHLAEDDHKSFKKKKKKNRKASHTEESLSKSGNEPLEFEEGEIIDDKPKQVAKKGKKNKPKPDSVAEVNENIDNSNKQKAPIAEKDVGEKKIKKKKEKTSFVKDKNEKVKEPKEKTLKPGLVDENISWKKISKNTKERNYRDAKEKEDRDRRRESKEYELAKKRNKEKRKELERYNVRRLIREKPKRPKKDEFGRDISPSKSGSSLSPYRPPRYRSPLRARNRSRTRSRSHRSRSRSKGRRRQSKSRERVKSREMPRRPRSKERVRKRSLSRKKVPSRERRKTPEKSVKKRISNRSTSRTKRRSRSQSVPPKRRRSISLSRSWTPSFSRSSMSRSLSPGRHRSKSFTRSRSPSWTHDPNIRSKRAPRNKDPPKNLTVIVTNKEALRKKEKKKLSKRKDDRRKRRRGLSPAPSKEVFTSGDNILVSVNFKNANKNAEVLPPPVTKDTSKRKRDDADSVSKKKKTGSNSKKSPTLKKSNRLARINEVAKNSKPVAIIDLDLSPFREQTPSPKEVIVLSDSGDEVEKQVSEIENQLERLVNKNMSQSMMSLSSNDHGQKGSLSQPESPLSSNFMMNSSGPKTPPEPHIKFSIASKQSQIRIMSNPLMEEVEEELQDEHIENEMNEILHKGPNTPPEPPPDLNTPASPQTTPYDPFDPTKSRSPSPQPREADSGSQLNISREDNLTATESGDEQREIRNASPPSESTELRRTPEPAKGHSTPKTDFNNSDISPKGTPPSDPNKLSEDNITKSTQKSLSSANKMDVSAHKSPEKLVTGMSQQVKNINMTPKQPVQPLKIATPIKHQTPKANAKVQLFSNSLIKQVPILGTLPLLTNPAIYAQSLLNNSNKSVGRVQQNGDPSDDMDIDPSSPYSPGSSEGDDLFEPPMATPPRSASKPTSANKHKPMSSSSASKFDALFGSPAKPRHGRHSSKATKKGVIKAKAKGGANKKEEIKVKLDEDQLKILDDLPSSAVEMQFLKKLNRQERVVEEVKLVLKPHYVKKHVTKEEYKDILRRAVPKICHNKSGEINPMKIQSLIEAYVKKFRYAKKKSSGAFNVAATQNKPKQQKTLWS